jgi:hypothetical protein
MKRKRAEEPLPSASKKMRTEKVSLNISGTGEKIAGNVQTTA